MQRTILYTANLRGDIEQLPRLYTFLRQLKASSSEPTLLLDVGQACATAAWHCEATGGRSMLLVFDAMGYHAANTTDYLTTEGRAKLAENILNVAALGADDVWEQDDVLVTTDNHPGPAQRLHIVLKTATETQLKGNSLLLAAVTGEQVGSVRIGPVTGNGRLAVLESTVHTLPATILPDPTIAATVEFVLSEARYYQQRHNDSS